MDGQFNHFIALEREYRKSALQVHKQWYQETVARFLVKKAKKLEKSATNHLDLSPIMNGLSCEVAMNTAAIIFCTAHKCQLRSN